MTGKTIDEKSADRIELLEKQIAEDMQTIKDLRESEERFRNTFEQVALGIVHAALDGRFIKANQCFCDIVGYTKEEIHSRTFQSITHPDDLKADLVEVEQLLEDRKKSFSLEKRYIRKNGSTVWVNLTVSLVRGESGDPKYYLGIVEDITERKRADEELKGEKERFQLLVKESPVGVSMIGGDGRYEYVNPKFVEIFGYTLADIPTGKDWFYKAFPDREYRKQVISTWVGDQEGLESGESRPRTFTVRSKDGSEKVIHFRPVMMETGQQLVMYEDITDRDKSEKALRESELKYQSLADSSLTGIFIHQDDRYVYVNNRFAEMHGYTPEELLEKKHYELIHPDQREMIKQRSYQRLKEEAVPRRYEIKRLKKNGEAVWHEIIVSDPIMYKARPAIMGHEIDITDRKRSEEALRQSEKRYRSLVEESIQGIVIVRDEILLFVNRATAKMFGYDSPDDLIGKNIYDTLVAPEEKQKMMERAAAVLDGRSIPVNPSWKGIRKDGMPIWIQSGASLIPWQGQPAVLGFYVDVTENKRFEAEKERLESHLRQSQKMEAIGTLAGGIAHDFNNILGIIIGNAELALDEVPEWNPARHNLEEVRKACLRAKEIVKQILTFSRQSENMLKPVRIGPIIRESLSLLRSSIPTTIEIRQNISAEFETVNADPVQINQVLINLCTNAAYAMKEKGGVIEVGLGTQVLDAASVVNYPDLAPGEYVKLTVSDTGFGIPLNILARIFDPFFTTKKVGEGTGMGLALVHGIVKNHGGAISVDSQPEKGATFQILLPTIKSDIPSETKEKPPLPKGTEHILFVDDEKAIVDVFQPMLERLGYKVTSRTSSIEAFEAFCHKHHEFDLVITDMTMPNMTGVELAKALMKIRSDIPVIICSGYSAIIDEDKTRDFGIDAFVMKPFVMREIAQTIRQVLDRQ